MRYVEFQFSSDILKDLFAYGLRTKELLTSESITIGKDDELLLSRAVWGDIRLARGPETTVDIHWEDWDHDGWTPVTAYEVGIMIELKLYVAYLHGRGSSRPYLYPTGPDEFGNIPVDCSIWVVITASVDASGQPSIAFTPKYASVPLPRGTLSEWDYASLKARLEERLVDAVPPRSMPVPLGRLRSLHMTFVAAGVAVNALANALAIRFQGLPRIESAVEEWAAFFAGTFEQALVGHRTQDWSRPYAWAIVVDENTLGDLIKDGVYDGLQSQKDITLISGVGADLQPDVTGRVVVSFRVNVDAPGPVNPDADVLTILRFDATPTGKLRETSDTSVSLDKGTQILVNLTVDLLAPIVGRWVLFVLAQVYAPAAEGGIALGMLGAIFTEERIAVAPGQPPPGEWTCDQPTRGMQVCVMEGSVRFSVVGAGEIELRLSDVYSTDTALVERGTVMRPQLPVDPVLKEALASETHWVAPEISCARAGGAGKALAAVAADPFGSLVAEADVDLVGLGTLHVAAATVVSADPAGVVLGTDIVSSVNRITLRVRFRSNLRYQADPYGFSLLVQTNGGDRLVALGPIPAMSDELAKHLVLDGLYRLVSVCFRLEDAFYEAFHRLNPVWAVDPEIDVRELVSRSWGLIREHAESLPIDLPPPERE